MDYLINKSTVTAAQNDVVSINSNRFTTIKRKFENDGTEFQSAKRINFIHSLSRNLIYQQQNMPGITFASPDYKPNFKLSANATANRANIISERTPLPMVEDIMMTEEDFTDEDEILQTPSYMSSYSTYMIQDVGQDLDKGGYTGSLELGWNEMYNL